jgi:hypothetical protein
MTDCGVLPDGRDGDADFHGTRGRARGAPSIAFLTDSFSTRRSSLRDRLSVSRRDRAHARVLPI